MCMLVIQAGGKSRRMGQHKVLMPFCGEPLFDRMLRRTSGLADESFHHDRSAGKAQIPGFTIDNGHTARKGSPGGLYTALAVAANSEIIVVACDMPFINPGLLLTECDLLSIIPADAVIPVSPFGNEPFHAVYRRKQPLRGAKSVGRWPVTPVILTFKGPGAQDDPR